MAKARPEPVAAPGSTVPKEPDAAQAEAEADIARCQASETNADTCCNNPAACMIGGANQNLSGPLADQSLGEYCKQMQNLGRTSADTNGTAAATCYNTQSSCSKTCSNLVTKYETLADNCDTCSSISIYESAIQTFLAMKASCDQLAARVQMLNNQALAANSGAGSGDLCNQVTQAQPQSLGGPTASGSSAALNPVTNSVGSHGCQLNPESPECKALLEGQAQPTGTASFQATTRKTASKTSEDFNIFPSSYPDTRTARGNTSAQASSHAIPSGSGQGAANSGGSGFESITDSAHKNVAGTTGTADVLQGSLRSGGGYSYGGSNSQNAATRNLSGATARNPASDGFDLKKRLASWMSYVLPSSKPRSQFKNLGKVHACSDGRADCSHDSVYPETMGYFDGDWIPVGGGTHGKYKLLFPAVAMLGILGALAWLKWSLVKTAAIKFTSRMPWLRMAVSAKSIPQPNRRKQELPVANTRRRVS